MNSFYYIANRVKSILVNIITKGNYLIYWIIVHLDVAQATITIADYRCKDYLNIPLSKYPNRTVFKYFAGPLGQQNMGQQKKMGQQNITSWSKGKA